MEQRLANTWRLSVNEKKFIETALLSDVRVDGRRPFDYRELTIKFGREDGSSEVHLGETHVISFVTAQLVQPYRDRPNEGSLSIYTEFSPMADPSFEAGRPGESAVELGRIIDRGLRESRAVDTESLCVLTGKLVWSVRVDLHILDNGGNLHDAANIAALAALLTFRRPECSLGENGQEVIVHPPEVHEPQALIVHHLPIAVTFAFMTDDNIVVIDPTYYEEAIMKGRMTATVNANEDVCAIQKAGEVGIAPSVVMQCLRTASVKAADITKCIENAVKMYNTDRAHRKVKLLPSLAVLNIDPSNSMMDGKGLSMCERTVVSQQTRKLPSQEECIGGDEVKTEKLSYGGKLDASNIEARRFMKGPSCWDPFSKGVDSKHLKAALVPSGFFKDGLMAIKENEQISEGHLDLDLKVHSAEILEKKNLLASFDDAPNVQSSSQEIKSLKDAVKPKSKRKKLMKLRMQSGLYQLIKLLG